jgi:hypothetical protein
MNFPYAQFTLPDGRRIYRPMLPITFKHGRVSFPVHALADTGADETILPMAFAAEFGFTFDLEADRVAYQGAGGNGFIVYPSPELIEHCISGPGFRPIRWKGRVSFTLDQPTILLGHRDCLERFNLTFKGKERTFAVGTLLRGIGHECLASVQGFNPAARRPRVRCFPLIGLPGLASRGQAPDWSIPAVSEPSADSAALSERTSCTRRRMSAQRTASLSASSSWNRILQWSVCRRAACSGFGVRQIRWYSRRRSYSSRQTRSKTACSCRLVSCHSSRSRCVAGSAKVTRSMTCSRVSPMVVGW